MNEGVPNWLIPNRVYDVLKWIGLIVCPAMAVLFGTVSQAWGIDSGTSQAVVLTLNAVGACIGVVIGASAFNARGGENDGESEE